LEELAESMETPVPLTKSRMTLPRTTDIASDSQSDLKTKNIICFRVLNSADGLSTQYLPSVRGDYVSSCSCFVLLFTELVESG
jgi:hypothetical protein